MNSLVPLFKFWKQILLFIGFMIIMSFLYHNDVLTNFSTYITCSTILFGLLIFFFFRIKRLIERDGFYKYLFPITIVAIFLAILPALKTTGWTQNHDGLLWKIRIETYVMHLSQFDLFPIWSTRDGHGMGTPDALFYHKLYYYVSAFFYILTANMKNSIVITVGVFMFIGAWGSFRIAKFLGNRNWVALLIGLCFLFLNYTLTNWLLRGAMAEFSAMAFIPLLILEELKLIRFKRYSHWLGLTLFLLYLSHSIIGYYAIFTVIISLFISFIGSTKNQIASIIKRISISAAMVIGVVMIYLIPMISLSDYYDSSSIKSGESSPAYKIVNFGRYFYDTEYEWFSEPYWNLSVQQDLPILVVILVALGIYSIRRNRCKPDNFSKKAITLFLLGNFFFLYLQTKHSLWFYELFPGASFIQFPWRLLSFIQVFNLIIFAWLLSRLEQSRVNKLTTALPLLAIALLMFNYPAYHGSMEKWFTDDLLERPTGTFCSNGEFLPQMYGQEFSTLNQAMYMYQNKGIEFDKSDNHLKMLNDSAILYEALEMGFEANINNPSEVILPFSYSSLTRMFKNDSIQIPIYRNESDPRIRAFLPHGNYTLTIKNPTLSSYFIPKKRPFDLPDYEDEIICDAEQLSENGSKLLSKCGTFIFTHFNNRTEEEAHSGKHSLKLGGHDIYGFTHDLAIEKDYDCEWEVSVWRKGSNEGSLVITFEDAGSTGTNTATITDSLGWEQLKVKFKIPKTLDREQNIKIYVFLPDAAQVCYFDDLMIRKL